MCPAPTERPRERGQLLVLFALGLVAMVAMVGLVLDGSDTFNQRRGQQNGADLAALAGANAYMNSYYATRNVATARSAAQAAAVAAATTNGYTNGVGATVSTTVTLLSAGAEVRVNVTKPHPNTFSRVMGFASWDVSVTAAARAFVVDTAIGAAPWIMHKDAFDADGTPKWGPGNPHWFGVSNNDAPDVADDIAWTDYNGGNNVDSAEVHSIIAGDNIITATFQFGQYLGQHNQGYHTTLFDDTVNYLFNEPIPVPIVGPGDPECPGTPGYTEGCFYGWAFFVVTDAEGGSTKKIKGYFLEDFKSQPLTVGECTPAMEAAGACGVISFDNPFGAFVVRLTD
ncbi:MAG: hypothetical protein FIA92_05215 [Chloroflexi bacterium]|nr:hypothetical protein [Chloroflexota bacterium]